LIGSIVSWIHSFLVCAKLALLLKFVDTIEAALLLLLAAALARFVQFSRWRNLLASAPGVPMTDGSGDLAVVAVRSAIDRAENRLIGWSFKCLPRAMAAQWMLRRRGFPATLLIGAARQGDARHFEFHAWVEYNSRVAIGGTVMDLPKPIFVLAPH
jgi:hypothetical protein